MEEKYLTIFCVFQKQNCGIKWVKIVLVLMKNRKIVNC